MSLVEADGDTDDSDKELANQHASGTDDEERAAAKLLDGVEGERGGANVDEGENEGDQKGVRDCPSRLQEGSRVVEDEVNTGPGVVC